MENEITSFLFEGNSVRTAFVNNEPYFCAVDLTRLLGYADNKSALRDHCESGILENHESKDEGQKVTPMFLNIDVKDAIGRMQSTKFIDEANMWRLVFRSHLPKGEVMVTWLTREVVPTLRKTGTYSLKNDKKIESAIDKETRLMMREQRLTHKVNMEMLALLQADSDRLVELGVNKIVAQSLCYDKATIQGLGDYTENKKLLPHVNSINYINPTEIAVQLFKKTQMKTSSIKVNIKLNEKGYQIKDCNGGWIATDLGKEYSAMFPYANVVKSTHSGLQLKWKDTIVDILKESMLSIS